MWPNINRLTNLPRNYALAQAAEEEMRALRHHQQMDDNVRGDLLTWRSAQTNWLISKCRTNKLYWWFLFNNMLKWQMNTWALSTLRQVWVKAEPDVWGRRRRGNKSCPVTLKSRSPVSELVCVVTCLCDLWLSNVTLGAKGRKSSSPGSLSSSQDRLSELTSARLGVRLESSESEPSSSPLTLLLQLRGRGGASKFKDIVTKQFCCACL